MRTELPLEALARALSERATTAEVVHHSAPGTQYASDLYGHVLASEDLACSIFATLKAELIHRESWPTRLAAQLGINDFIGSFYNCHRRYSHLGYLTPIAYGPKCEAQVAQAA